MAEASTMFSSYRPQGGAGNNGLVTAGLWLSVFGSGMTAISAFYEAKSAKHQAESAALNADFEESIANINARNAELDAQSILEAGQLEAGQRTMAYGQERASRRASQAARGLLLGVGNTAEEIASVDYAKEVDALSINSNAARAAAAARMQGASYGANAAVSRVNASNARASGRSINPWMSAGTTLLGSAGEISSRWAYYKTRRS